LIQDALAKRVLDGTFRDGDTIEVDAGHEGQLVFRKRNAEQIVESEVMA